MFTYSITSLSCCLIYHVSGTRSRSFNGCKGTFNRTAEKCTTKNLCCTHIKRTLKHWKQTHFCIFVCPLSSVLLSCALKADQNFTRKSTYGFRKRPFSQLKKQTISPSVFFFKHNVLLMDKNHEQKARKIHFAEIQFLDFTLKHC